MELPVWFEVSTFVGLTVLLLADLAIVARRPHEPSVKEASIWVSFYVALAMLFGAAVIERFIWVFYIFGAFLVYTAINLVRHRSEDEDYEENAFIRRMRRVLPMTQDFQGAKIRVTENGKKLWTPMVIVFLALGTTDLLFALDSIPAIFGLTREPFIVFTANVFALMGLRQLYFLLGGLLKRLVYLSLGLAVILAFIGVKLVMEALHENSLPFINGGEHIDAVPAIPIWLSLSIILGVLVIATVASLLKTRGEISAEGPATATGEAPVDTDATGRTVP